jgi:hypothetical protein
MKLFIISQDVNGNYDTYDSAVVCAETIEQAQMTHPGHAPKDWDGKAGQYSVWCNAEDVKVQLIGTANEYIKEGVICASFNAG